MSALAVIATFYRRPWAIDRIGRSLVAQGRAPDRIWVMFEARDDADLLAAMCEELPGAEGWQCYPPENTNPLGYLINEALDRDDSDYITYLTDDSLPDPRKYEVMARALDENPEWGAVYCSQDYGRADDPEHWLAGGTHQGFRRAEEVEWHPFARVDHTQVMHRRTEARWPLSYNDRRLSDAHFFRDLVDDLGPLYPIPEVLDWTRQLPDGLSNR